LRGFIVGKTIVFVERPLQDHLVIRIRSISFQTAIVGFVGVDGLPLASIPLLARDLFTQTRQF